jgi:RNA polymerase sigma-70 factor (ECF subfamily)
LNATTEPYKEPAPLRHPPDAVLDADRVRNVVRAQYDFVWRSLRRLGVDAGVVEDHVQQVLLVFSRRVQDIPLGVERAFLFGTATKVAADYRKKRRRSPEVLDADVVEAHPSGATPVDRRIDEGRARELLDVILDEMPFDLRTVFVLFELEGLTMAAIAELTELAPGTVASRLRRARDLFKASAARWQRGKAPLR